MTGRFTADQLADASASLRRLHLETQLPKPVDGVEPAEPRADHNCIEHVFACSSPSSPLCRRLCEKPYRRRSDRRNRPRKKRVRR